MQHDDITKLRKQGCSLWTIARRTGVPRAQVKEYLESQGLLRPKSDGTKPRGRPAVPQQTIARMLILRNLNMSFTKIGASLGVSHTTVSNYLCGPPEVLEASCKTLDERVAFDIYMERRYDT